MHDGDALRVLTADGEVHELPLSVPASSGWLVDLGVVLAGRQGVTDAGRDQLIRSSDAEISAALQRLETALAADDSLGARELRARLVAVGLMGEAVGP